MYKRKNQLQYSLFNFKQANSKICKMYKRKTNCNILYLISNRPILKYVKCTNEKPTAIFFI